MENYQIRAISREQGKDRLIDGPGEL
jgi:hypothetical protein